MRCFYFGFLCFLMGCLVHVMRNILPLWVILVQLLSLKLRARNSPVTSLHVNGNQWNDCVAMEAFQVLWIHCISEWIATFSWSYLCRSTTFYWKPSNMVFIRPVQHHHVTFLTPRLNHRVTPDHKPTEAAKLRLKLHGCECPDSRSSLHIRLTRWPPSEALRLQAVN